MATKNNIKIPNPIEGVIRTAQLDDSVAPENSVQIAVNLNFDRIGAMQTRPGLTNYATQLSGKVISLGTLNIQSTGVKRLFSQVAKDISVWNGAAWTSVRTLTVDGKARFTQFLDRVWMVNGSNGDSPKTSNGGAFDTTDVPATFPKADFINAGFEGRVWVADKTKDILYYTDIVQSTDGTTYVTPLTFDITKNFISKFSPQDGESITALWRVPRALLLFKQNHIYRIFSSSNVDPYPAYNVGTYSQESIVETKEGLFFHHPSGFYKFAYDGQPVEISRRIIDFVRAIPRANYENIVGIWDGFDAIKWYVGSMTVDGVNYSNCTVRYTLSTQVWTVYDYEGNNITSMIRFDDGANIKQIGGTNDGHIISIDEGETDLGKSIYYEMIDRERGFGETEANTQAITGLYVVSENGGGAQFQYQIQKDETNEWHDIGKLEHTEVSLFPNVSTEDFNEIRFRLRGYTNGEPIVFKGMGILTLIDKGFDKN